MESKIYIDTNIFIDLMDSTRPYYKGSFAFVKSSILEGKTLYINSDTITNAFYILNKNKSRSSVDLLTLMKKMVALFVVVSVENEEAMMALSLCEDAKCGFKDYEDALQYVCAKKIEANLIVTNDKGFVALDIEIVGTK